MAVKACVLFAAGTNCEHETKLALETAGARVDIVHINQLLEDSRLLDDYRLLVIPGGFSYGDYVASGRILATELKERLRPQLTRFVEDGRLILGICNGFQVLVKAGMLPAFDGLFGPQIATLDANDSGRYEDRWVHLAIDSSPCVFTQGLAGLLELPVAHAEGKFVTKTPDVLRRLQTNRQIVLRYVTVDGQPARYPDNPNGSVLGIAGICDPSGRIFGLMPHPERFIRPEHHPRWHRLRPSRIDGISIFVNALRYLGSN